MQLKIIVKNLRVTLSASKNKDVFHSRLKAQFCNMNQIPFSEILVCKCVFIILFPIPKSILIFHITQSFST